MRIRFDATEATAEPIDGIDGFLSGVRGLDDNGTDRYLILQREFDGTEGVYLELDDQINSDYGCVAACRLSRSELAVDLNRPLGPLSEVSGIDVTLCFDDDDYVKLHSGLTTIFRGSESEFRIMDDLAP